MIRLVLALGLFFFCSVLLAHGQARVTKDAEVAAEIRRWCVGRSTMELPASFEQRSLNASVGLPRAVAIKGLGPGTLKDLERRVDARSAVLEQGVATDHHFYRAAGRAQRGDMLLLGRREFDPDLPSFDPGFIGIEAYFTRNGYMFQAVADAFETLDQVNQLGDGAGQLGLNDIARHIRPLENSAIPPGPGLCLDRAFLDAPVLASDSFSSSFYDPSKPGLVLSIELSHHAVSPAEPYLDLLSSGRSSSRTIDGVQGKELRVVAHPGGMT